MSVTVYRRCCGMDVHKDRIVVCVLPPDGKDGLVVRKTYGTFRNDLTRMRGWLKLLKVTEIAMESTGSIGGQCGMFWKIRDSGCCW